MTLPYGCMTDEEMKAMPIPQLQEDGGLLFLWVTGRAVSLKVQLPATMARPAGLIPPSLFTPRRSLVEIA